MQLSHGLLDGSWGQGVAPHFPTQTTLVCLPRHGGPVTARSILGGATCAMPLSTGGGGIQTLGSMLCAYIDYYRLDSGGVQVPQPTAAAQDPM